jgi:hypothetical protein
VVPDNTSYRLLYANICFVLCTCGTSCSLVLQWMICLGSQGLCIQAQEQAWVQLTTPSYGRVVAWPPHALTSRPVPDCTCFRFNNGKQALIVSVPLRKGRCEWRGKE